MKYNTATLSSGLRVIHLPSPSAVVYCGYEVNCGSADEDSREEGIAHFCEHMTFKGTQRRRAIDIINCLESVGGDLNAFTTKADTVYYAALLAEHLPRAVDLLTDIVFHSIYPQEEINKEVEVICDEIESYNDSPSELIFDEFDNLIFRGHPLGHNILGTANGVRRFTTADALNFTHRFYRPSNSIFFVSGNISFDNLLRLLADAGMGSRVDGAAPPQMRHAGNGSSTAKAQQSIIDRHTHQAHVMLGCRAYDIHHPLRIALYLLNNILGGPGMNSRLNLSLRERRGLVYTVESTMASYDDEGEWSVYLGCDVDDIDTCLELVTAELGRFIGEKLSAEELAAAKQQLKGQIGVACDNRESFALDFGRSFLHWGWEKDITSLYRHIDEVTPEMIQQVARELFPKENLSLLIFK